MSEIKIKWSDKIDQKIKGTSWGLIVGSLAKKTQALFSVTPEFFPEYTDHGVGHINRVIENIERLIPEKVLNNSLSEMDIGILLCSAIIHDIGMFLDGEGFTKLINIETDVIEGFKLDMPYNYLWEDYRRKFIRHSPEWRKRLVGKSSQVLSIYENPVDWTKRDRMLIGDFLRSHHHRLAHEIAINGFKGIDIFSEEVTEKQKNIIGLLSRSHRINIRNLELETFCKKYLGGDGAYIDDCPIYYFIALLQLADSLDTGVERAPRELSDFYSFSSTESRSHWELNQIFNYSSFGWRKAKETRTLRMPANPKNTTAFVRAEKHLLKIQQEFDVCVAVIDELYNRKYSLSIRRVESDISESNPLSREGFAEKFIINDCRLSASPDILPLLAKPLYSNDPAFGVRELIQNAVDACKERAFLDENFKGLITIEIDTVKGVFTITDNGIGMSEEVILKYYLRAGAVYRNSEYWQNIFMDEIGKSKLTRIGRFGIGALATFLLGDHVTVSTCHVDSGRDSGRGRGKGVKFSYTLNIGNSIDAECDPSIPEGTMISIKLSESVKQYFGDKDNIKKYSRWYYMESPIIKFVLDGSDFVNEYLVPSTYKAEDGWFFFKSLLFEDILWSYKRVNPSTGVRLSAELICNGILVSEIEFPYHQKGSQWDNRHWGIIRKRGFDIHLPLISVKDNNCEIAMDLSRRYIDALPLEDDFVVEIYKYFIAELLVGKFTKPSKEIVPPSNWEGDHGYIPIAYHNAGKGYTVLARSFILNTKEKEIWCYIGDRKYIKTNVPIGFMARFGASKDVVDSIHYCTNQSITSKTYLNGDLLMDGFRLMGCCPIALLKERSNSSNNFISGEEDMRKIFEAIIKANGSPLPCSVNRSIALSELFKDKTFEDTYLLVSDYVKDDFFNDSIEKSINDLATELDDNHSMFLYYTPTPVSLDENNLMLMLLEKYIPVEINDGWIPYDMEERKRIYKYAFDELEPYINGLNKPKSHRVFSRYENI